MRAIGTVTSAVALLLWLAAAANAAPSWQAPQTIKTVRGVPDPRVGISAAGMATIVFADAAPGAGQGVFAVRRSPGGSFGAPSQLGYGADPQLAVAPDGTTAVAWRDAGAIQLLVAPPGGALAGGVRHTLTAPGAYSDAPRLGIAGDGRATLLWRVSDSGGLGQPVQLRVATVTRDGALSGPDSIGGEAACDAPALSANLSGDAVAYCQRRAEAYVRGPAGAFETVPFGLPGFYTSSVAVDGAGTAMAIGYWDDLKSMGVTQYRLRARGGSFDAPRPLPRSGAVTVVNQERRSVAAWSEGGRLGYAIRPAGGDFGPARRSDVRVGPISTPTPIAPLGPLPLLFLDEPSDRGRLAAAQIGVDDVARALGEPAIPGIREFPVALAAAESGIAVATWEQRCGEGFAVMAMVLDERRGTSDPPCQDRVAPRVLIRPKRARLAGRSLRFRVGCDESCRLVVRTRVVGSGRRKPLATAKTPRPRPLPASGYRAFKLRLRAADAVRVRASLKAGRRVTVRFALSVRDDFENGAVRRLVVPLR